LPAVRVPASDAPLRFGLVGTGYRARITHAPALARVDGVAFSVPPDVQAALARRAPRAPA